MKCGITSPTKPIIPQKATTLAINKQLAKITIFITKEEFIPNKVASSFPKDSISSSPLNLIII